MIPERIDTPEYGIGMFKTYYFCTDCK